MPMDIIPHVFRKHYYFESFIHQAFSATKVFL